MQTVENKEGSPKWIKHQKYHYRFNENINRVWKFLKDFSKTYHIFEDLRSREVFTKGNSSYEKGAEFSFVWEKKTTFYCKVFNVFDTPEHKILHFKMKCEKNDCKFENIFNLYDVSVQKSTLLVWDYIYEGKGASKTPTEMEHDNSEKTEIIHRLANLLRSNVEDLEQHESILINYPLENVWKIISNWKIFQKVVPCIATEIEFLGNPEAVGSLIVLKWKKDDLAVRTCKLRVQEKIFDVKGRNFIFKLVCLDKSSENPNHELILKLTDVESNDTLIEFTHIFLQPFPRELIPQLSKYKIRILKHLKLALNEFKKRA